MIYIGFDQSYTSTGYCVYEDTVIDYGTLHTSKDDLIYDRAGIVAKNIIDIINKYPNCRVSLEGLAFGMMGSATRDLAGLQFVIINNIKQHTHVKDVTIISPTSLKKFATGSGGSKKIKVTKPIMFKSLPDEYQKLFKQKHKASTGLYDITDAYYLAKYLQDLCENGEKTHDIKRII